MKIDGININEIVKHFSENVFRVDTKKPGFAFFDFGKKINSIQLRTIMVELKIELSKLTIKQFNKKLTYEWLGRFDQQVSTKYHLDNAGNQSFLMLGYEPSEIESDLFLADYVKFSKDKKIEPSDYFDKYNPIFKDNETVLKPYITKVENFHKDTYKIVLINNSNSKSDCETLGVLHMARISKPDLNKNRVINSMMLSMVHKLDTVENEIDEDNFKNTYKVSKQNIQQFDKTLRIDLYKEKITKSNTCRI